MVDKRATTAGTCISLEGITPPTITTPTGHGDLQIENATGGTVLDQTMYAYISHGPDGYGAFPAQGSTVGGRINSGSTDTDEMTNAGVGAGFVYNTTNWTNVRVQKDATTTFDDIVWYRPDIKNTCCLGADLHPDRLPH